MKESVEISEKRIVIQNCFKHLKGLDTMFKYLNLG